MRSKSKRKMDALEVNKELMDFISYMEDADEPEIASEFLLSQLSYLVSTLTKAKQAEFMAGLNECRKDVAV